MSSLKPVSDLGAPAPYPRPTLGRLFRPVLPHDYNVTKNLKLPFGLDKLGTYPAEYNPRVHGPYNPSRLYAARAADTPLLKVKLSDIPAWLSRREMTFESTFRMFSRQVWKYHLSWLHTKTPSPVPFLQMALFISVVSMAFTIQPYMWDEPVAKYH